jgi:hypothetical protein
MAKTNNFTILESLHQSILGGVINEMSGHKFTSKVEFSAKIIFIQ